MKENRNERVKTIRQEITTLLIREELNAREISQTVGIREKEVYEHISHIARSVMAQGNRLKVRPALCLTCGFSFNDRKRFNRPGRCAKCKGTHLQSPTYRIAL